MYVYSWPTFDEMIAAGSIKKGILPASTSPASLPLRVVSSTSIDTYVMMSVRAKCNGLTTYTESFISNIDIKSLPKHSIIVDMSNRFPGESNRE